jgi:serine protease Do
VYQLREYGETRRGWLGVRIQTVTDDLAESLGLDRSRGALVASISADSPAAAAGIEVGDVIVAFDGKSVETMRRLPRIVAETQIDKQVTVEVWRDGAVVALPVTVGRLDETGTQVASAALPGPEAPVLSEVPALGLTLSALTDELRTEFQIQEDVNGVMVVAVDVSGVAAEKGVQPGDIIVEVGQEEVSTPADVEAKVEEHRQHDKRTVLLLLDRQGDLQFIALRLLDS